MIGCVRPGGGAWHGSPGPLAPLKMGRTRHDYLPLSALNFCCSWPGAAPAGRRGAGGPDLHFLRFQKLLPVQPQIKASREEGGGAGGLRSVVALTQESPPTSCRSSASLFGFGRSALSRRNVIACSLSPQELAIFSPYAMTPTPILVPPLPLTLGR